MSSDNTHIVEQLRSLARPVDEFTLDPTNARIHDEDNLEVIRTSLKKYGQRQPIVVQKDGMIVRAGNARLIVARKLGWKTIAAVVIDEPDLAATAYGIIDNRSSEMAEWSDETLAKLLASIQSENPEMLEATGFDESELEELLAEIAGEPDVIQDDVPEPPAEPVAKLGQLWALGDHRLLCGDSTKTDDVERLMDGEKARMVFTDPPYALFGNSTGVAGIVDDKMTRPFFLEVFRQSRAFTKLFAHIYVCCDWHSAFSLQAMAREAGLTEKNLCIWDKGDGGIGAMYQQCYEMVWFFANSPIAAGATAKKAVGERTINGKPNIWRFPRELADRSHNAQKPVEMVAGAVSNSSDPKDIVLDLFLGGGTTLIAAEQLDRTCYAMDLEPKYCDVTIARWEKLTGQKAELLEESHA